MAALIRNLSARIASAALSARHGNYLTFCTTCLEENNSVLYFFT